MRINTLFLKKLGIAALPIAFALLAIFYPNLPEQKLDTSILLLILLAILVVVLPWERLTSFKAAGVELELDKPQIDKAISDLEALKGIADGKASKMYVPYEASALLSGLGSISDILKTGVENKIADKTDDKREDYGKS